MVYNKSYIPFQMSLNSKSRTKDITLPVNPDLLRTFDRILKPTGVMNIIISDAIYFTTYQVL